MQVILRISLISCNLVVLLVISCGCPIWYSNWHELWDLDFVFHSWIKENGEWWATGTWSLLYLQGDIKQSNSLTTNNSREKEVTISSPRTPFRKVVWAANELLRWLGLLWKALCVTLRRKNLLWLFALQQRWKSLQLIFIFMSWGAESNSRY